MTAHCERSQALSHPGRPSLPPAASAIAATAPKDSQKPGEETDIGSNTATSPSARPRTVGVGQRRRLHNAAATTASMSTVRCAGTAKPDRSA